MPPVDAAGYIRIEMTTRFIIGQTSSAQGEAGVNDVHRGIRLPKPAVPPRTPIAALRKAVQTAFDQNAGAIRRIK